MNDNRRKLLFSSIEKARKSIAILEASINKISPFDPDKSYTYDELEPYDALSDRFIRSVEVLFRLLRTLQIYNEGISSETLRDLLLYSEKTGFITSVDIWLEMREVRNKIAHDYLPAEQKLLFEDITGPFIAEIRFVSNKIGNIVF